MTTKTNQIAKGNDLTHLHNDWVRTLIIAIPFGALAYVVGALLEGPSGQATMFDRVAYPVLALSMLLLEVLLILRPQRLQLVTSAICLGSASFFLLKLNFLLFFRPAGIDPLHQMTETFFWIPIIYLLSFLIPGMRTGQIASVTFTALTLALSLIYVAQSLTTGFDWGVIYALSQMNIANSVFLCLTFAFIKLKERYTVAKNEESVANHLARFDQLTELPNRRSLDELLERLLEQKESFALLFVDVDGFKQVNDSLGHQAGDQLLKDIAARLNQCLGPNDFVVRLSGDEFVWIAKTKDREEVEISAKALIKSFNTKFMIAGKSISVTASVGLCFYPQDGHDVKTLLQHADIAMYQAKKAGKNAYRIYEASMSAELEQKRELEQDLKDAIVNAQLELHYQPIFDLRSNALVKFEALLRWKHPQRGYVSPAQFIPLAEDTGLIIPIGSWVLEQAIIACKAWQGHMPGVGVAVNISPLQLGVQDFSEQVPNLLSRHDLAAPCLELEVTESVVLGNLEQVTRCLNHLRSLGVNIAIDDFGTGYSSLAYLQNLPVDTLKIDQSFIHKLATPLEEPHFAVALIEAIIGLSRHLDLSVVAEGIETADQLTALRNAGCHLGQGYYFSKPVAQADLTKFYVKHEKVTSVKAVNLN